MQLKRVTIDTNPDQCNLNCIMCDTHSIYNKNFKSSRKSMPKEMLEKILDDVLKLDLEEIIPTTMGEPLLYKDFDIFIEKLSCSNTKLNLTTNGTFPYIGVEEWAKKLLPILSDIKISINSLDKQINESIMIKDNTPKKIEDIKKFVKLRDKLNKDVSITLQVTFMERNLDSLEDIIIFAIENDIDRVKGHQLWVNWQEMKKESLQKNQKSIERWNNFIQKIDKYKEKIKLVNFEKLEIGQDGLVPYNYVCPFLGKELWIDYNGDYNICCAPSDKRVTLGKWGNIEDTTILELFYSDKYINLVKSYKENKICKNCSLRIPL